MQIYLLALAFAASLIVAVYPKYASRRGWRVEPSFRKSGGTVMTLGIVSMFGSAILLLLRADWWLALLLLAAGAVAALATIRILKSVVQSIALPLIVFAWLWFAVMELRL